MSTVYSVLLLAHREVCERELIRGVAITPIAFPLPVRAVHSHAPRGQSSVIVHGGGVNLIHEITGAPKIASTIPQRGQSIPHDINRGRLLCQPQYRDVLDLVVREAHAERSRASGSEGV